jgi:pentatricopeptide repeat protein
VTYTTLISALLQLKSTAATKRATSLYSEMKLRWWIYPDTILVDT